MLLKNLLPVILLYALCVGCKPKPIDINMPQQKKKMVVSASCLNASTVLVAVGYSASSLRNLDDTAVQNEIPRDLLADSMLVYIAKKGQQPDTLDLVRPGVYGKKHLQLEGYTEYILTVIDRKNKTAATATTMYMPVAETDTIYPEVVNHTGEATIRLHVNIRNNRPHEYFFISYSTRRQAREIITDKHPALNTYTPKGIELIEDGGSGIITRTLTLQGAAVNDTLMVHVGHIDKPYYDYLSAYKRTGALINQVSGEPINLPTNLSSGYGYFALYQPVMKWFDLGNY